MTKKDLILSGIAGAGFAGAVVMTIINLRGQGPTEGLDRLSFWVCRNVDCATEFDITLAEFQALSEANDGYVPCPECGKRTTVRANPCPSCLKNVPTLEHDRLPDRCPHCDEPIGMGRGQNLHRHADGTTHAHDNDADGHGHEGP
ncbi:MAG: hypothetical protein ACIARR_08465 [Phycisphaerales bacterium JB059]